MIADAYNTDNDNDNNNDNNNNDNNNDDNDNNDNNNNDNKIVVLSDITTIKKGWLLLFQWLFVTVPFLSLW